MPLYLIGINKRNWDRDPSAIWLGEAGIPADVHQDLRVRGNALSVWHIEDDRSNLNAVITALAATRMAFDPFDYGLFDQALVRRSGIRHAHTMGVSPLLGANHWHRDLIELTVERLAALINAIFDHMQKDRIPKAEVRSMIVSAARSDKVDLSQLKPELHKKLTDLLGSS